jgi:large conductance mechanosensitive channel
MAKWWVVGVLLFLVGDGLASEVNTAFVAGSTIASRVGSEKLTADLELLQNSSLLRDSNTVQRVLDAANRAKEKVGEDLLKSVQLNVQTRLGADFPVTVFIIFAVVGALLYMWPKSKPKQIDERDAGGTWKREAGAARPSGIASMMSEFKDWAFHKNVWQFAIAILLAGSIKPVLDSLAMDIIAPLIAMLIHDQSFDDTYMVLKKGQNGGPYKTLADARDDGALTLNYGKFISVLFAFSITALALFALVQLRKSVQSKVDPQLDNIQSKIEVRSESESSDNDSKPQAQKKTTPKRVVDDEDNVELTGKDNVEKPVADQRTPKADKLKVDKQKADKQKADKQKGASKGAQKKKCAKGEHPDDDQL